MAAPVRRAPEHVRRRVAALTAQIRDIGPAELAAAWRARMATPAFWRPIGASVLLHIVALTGLAVLHRATFRTAAPPPIEIALMPSDPDARVGPHAGIRWESTTQRTAILALLEARRSSALTSEIVITPGLSPRAPSRPSLAARATPADPAPPARATPAEARPADARPADPAPTMPAVTQAAPAPEIVAEAVPRQVPPPPVAAESLAALSPARQSEPTPPPVLPAAAAVAPRSRPAEPPAAPPALASAAAPASPAPTDQGEKGYLQAVFERLRPIRDYPDLAKYHTSGRMQVAITVSRDGTVLNAQVRRSSGYGFLDRAGLDLIHRASPLPELPTNLARDVYTFEVPISFRYD